MHKRRFLVLLLLLGTSWYVNAKCTQSALAQMPFVVDFAVWRGWSQALIYNVDHKSNCRWALVRLVKCLSLNGVAAAVDICRNCQAQSRLGVVILSSPLRRNYTYRLISTVDEIIKLRLNTPPYDWLLIARSEYDIKLMNSVLNATDIRFDQNIIAVYPRFLEKRRTESPKLCDGFFEYGSKIKRNNKEHNRHNLYLSNKFIDRSVFETNYHGTFDRYRNISKNVKYLKFGKMAPLLRSGMTNTNTPRSFDMVNASALSLKKQLMNWRQINAASDCGMQIHVVQYIKVRTNSTLYASYLGAWCQERSLSLVRVPYSVEERNFLGEELIVGRSNSTGDSIMGTDDETSDTPVLLKDLLVFMNMRLNITSVTRYYGKLGFRTYEGVWTGLLGALMDSSVDIALEPVTALPSQYQDMDFIFPIAETMCSIYIRHQETSAVRDIFLAPFSARLVSCVLAVALVAAITVGLMSRVAINIQKEKRTMSITESFLWSIGIICQQGAQWTPPIPAASIVLIVCLLFAVVIYNAYAAFITSVLSVRVPSVGTVSDVLHSSNFKIGYIRNGADQMYLMSTKDVQLNAFYIRGYSEAENLVSSAEEGLARAARQDYAFFTGRLTARSTLRKLSQARGRCALRELPVPSTRAQLAFPLPKNSPYARSILIRSRTYKKYLMDDFEAVNVHYTKSKLRGSGTLARLEAALVPALPQCSHPSGFASAREADVSSALLLLLVGLIASLLIGIAEFFWKNRRYLRRFWFLCYRRLLSLY